MSTVLFCALLLIGGPLVAFLVIVSACLPGLVVDKICRPDR